MNNGQSKKLMWGLGISDQDADVIRQAAGNEFGLRCFPVGVTPDVAELENDAPAILWISKSGWDELQKLPSAERVHLEVASRILIMGGDYDLAELESLLECGFTEIIKPPITTERARTVLHAAIETQNLYQDIMHMTREICLERELLERKNTMLSFIVSFLERITRHLDPVEIIHAAQSELAKLLPVTSLNAICWTKQQTKNIHANVFVSTSEKNAASIAWTNHLKTHAQQLLGDALLTVDMNYVGCSESDILPQKESLLAINLEHGTECFGAIMLQCAEQPQLGKDQIQIIQSAVSHLTLALNNAMMFKAAEYNAETDGLTGLFNRRHFDQRLIEEDSRHRRYGHSMCLLITDIDNFKQINDSFGHLVGDSILQEFASILADSLRTSDYIARFGGEEFAILLPCTPARQGIMLAERLRDKIEQHAFSTEKGILNITTSIGVACLDTNHTESPVEIIRRADNALYNAKHEGKNQTSILYSDESLFVAGGYAS